MLVDSHVNLHSEQYGDDLESVIERAQTAGIRGMLTICDRLSSLEEIKSITDRHDFIWRTVGVHPHYAKDYPDLDAGLLCSLCEEADVIGVGECGLDFHYGHSGTQVQIDVFGTQILASRKTGLPLVIHSRNADTAMRRILEEAYRDGPFVPLLHCYTGGPELARAVLDMGGYISFSGIITFRNAADVRAVVQDVPLDRIIIETDCPFLAPVPMRGRRNEPAYITYVAEKLAEIKNLSAEKLAQITTENFFRLFPAAGG